MSNANSTGPAAAPPPSTTSGTGSVPRAPLSTYVTYADYRDGRGTGGITVRQKVAPGVSTTPRVPPYGGALAAITAPKRRQRSVSFAIDVADVNQLVVGPLAHFKATRAYLTVYAGPLTIEPLPRVVLERDFDFSSGTHTLTAAATVIDTLITPGGGFGNIWTVWLQVNGLFQAIAIREPERKTMLVRSLLPVTLG